MQDVNTVVDLVFADADAAHRQHLATQSYAEHMALGVLQVGGDVPPLDAKARVGAVVLGEAEDFSGHHLGKIRRVTAKASEAFRRRGGRVARAQ